jgi:hypothetical protein
MSVITSRYLARAGVFDDSPVGDSTSWLYGRDMSHSNVCFTYNVIDDGADYFDWVCVGGGK